MTQISKIKVEERAKDKEKKKKEKYVNFWLQHPDRF